MSEPATHFGRYVLVRRLARGGMAEIYLARQHAAGEVWRPVVIKRILPHLAQERRYVHMFLDEARLASRFSHPNIVQVLDLGEIDGQYFMAMEYVPGETIASVIRRGAADGRPLPLDLGLQVLIAVCDGLHHAHEYREGDVPLGVVHRDVSPSNVMLSYQGAVKVVDFGIARAAERLQDRTGTGVMKGKLAYIAPEVFAGRRPDRRADVWSVGVVAWEMLAGERLFRREAESATIRAVLDEPIPAPSSRRPLPPEVDAVVARALARDPDARYPTALALRRDLEALRVGPPGRLDDFLVELFGEERARSRIEIRPTLEAAEAPSGTSTIGEPTVQMSVAPITSTRWALPMLAASALGGVGIAVVALFLAIVVGAWWAGQPPDDRADRGMLHAQRGEYQQARQLLEAYLADHPDDARARIHALLVRWWTSAPHIDEAVAAAKAAPLDDAQRAFVEGLVLVNMGRNKDAEAYLVPVVAANPDRPELRYILGEAKWHAGDLHGGVEELLAAFDSDPRWLTALHHATDFLLDQGDRATLGRLQPLVQASDPVSGADLAARLAVADREYDRALEILEAALARSPEAPTLWALLSEVHALRGDLTAGRSAAGKAYDLWPIDDRSTGGTAHIAEYHLYEGQVDLFADKMPPSAPARALMEALWRGRGGFYRDRPPLRGLLSPPDWVASYLAGQFADGRSDPSFYEAYPYPSLRWYGAGLEAELEGDLDGAAAAYRAGLDSPQGGELRLLLAHHLARVRARQGDLAGAAEACDEVIHPRRYRTQRALLLPDCLVWTAETRGPKEAEALYRQLVEPWRGSFEHPATVRAKEALAGL